MINIDPENPLEPNKAEQTEIQPATVTIPERPTAFEGPKDTPKKKAAWRSYAEWGGMAIIAILSCYFLFKPAKPKIQPTTVEELIALANQTKTVDRNLENIRKENNQPKPKPVETPPEKPPVVEKPVVKTPPKVVPKPPQVVTNPPENPPVQPPVKIPPRVGESPVSPYEIILAIFPHPGDPDYRFILIQPKIGTTPIIVGTKNTNLIKAIEAGKIQKGTKIETEIGETDDEGTITMAKNKNAKPATLKKLVVKQ